MIQHFPFLRLGLVGALSATFVISVVPAATQASSHMDAPLITFDDAANTTDVYAFRSAAGGNAYLSTALAVYPFEEPGIGPNKYNFDDNVLYQIHVATGNDLAKGKATVSYQFLFKTEFKNSGTIAQSFLGVVEQVDDASQNLTQRYTVTKVDRKKRVLFTDAVVPPNNQGLVTKYYNQSDSGENPAREGVASTLDLDRYQVRVEGRIVRIAHLLDGLDLTGKHGSRSPGNLARRTGNSRAAACRCLMGPGKGQ